MDFSFTDEQKLFRETFVKALRRIVLPRAAEIDRDDRFPEDVFRELGGLGYYGIRYPAELGGLAGDTTTFTILVDCEP